MVKDLNIHVAKKVCEMNAVRVVNCNDGKLQNVLLYSLYVLGLVSWKGSLWRVSM